jgi:hypothetical protein
MIQRLETHDDNYGDSDFLAYRDIAIDDFRKSEKESKVQIIKKMIELRHNMKYNKHLLSVYLKAKSLFDNMVDEHRSQITYLEEIYHHINNMIRENHSKRKSNIMTELLKDKHRIGVLLKKMRNSYDKLTNVYTVLDVTVQKMNEMIVSLEEADPGSEFDSELDENEQEYVENYNDDDDVDDEDEGEGDDEDEDDEDEYDEDDDVDDEDDDDGEDEDEDDDYDNDSDEDDEEGEDDEDNDEEGEDDEKGEDDDDEDNDDDDDDEGDDDEGDDDEDEDNEDNDEDEDNEDDNTQTELHDIENEDDDPDPETIDPQERFIMVF